MRGQPPYLQALSHNGLMLLQMRPLHGNLCRRSTASWPAAAQLRHARGHGRERNPLSKGTVEPRLDPTHYRRAFVTGARHGEHVLGLGTACEPLLRVHSADAIASRCMPGGLPTDPRSFPLPID